MIPALKRRKRSALTIGLVGESGSGKETAARYLAKRTRGRILKFSTPLSQTLKLLHLADTKENEIDLAQVLRRRWGRDVLVRALLADRQADPRRTWIIDGVRYWEEARALRRLPLFRLLYITAPFGLRLARIRKRREKVSDRTMTAARLRRIERLPTEVQIAAIGATADVRIDNTGTIVAFHRAVDASLKQLEYGGR